MVIQCKIIFIYNAGCLRWVKNTEDSNGDNNLGFMLYGDGNDQCDHRKEFRSKWKYEQFFNFALVLTGVQKAPGKS